MGCARRRVVAAMVAMTLVAACPVRAEDEVMALYDGPGGATCQYFNVAGRVKWEHKNGDWKDAAGIAQGPAPFASATIEATNRSRLIEWDVTALAQKWLRGASANDGLLLATVPGQARGVVVFQSRESDVPEARPHLVLEFTDGSSQTAVASADVHLDCTTVQSFGQDKQMNAGPDTPLAMRFVVPPSRKSADVRRATLRLSTTARQYGNAVIGVYELAAPLKRGRGKPELGIAQNYPMDRDIDKNPDVYMASRFESPLWFSDWSYARPDLTYWPVADDDEHGFKALDGKALRVIIPRGGTVGLDLGYNFAGKTGHEPEEVYFRYYLRFANDWLPSVDGGKLPGISGTYGRAGWGGRKYDGKLGWSMRGGFARAPEEGNPMRQYVTMSTYAYHAGGEDFWGDEWVWDIGLRGMLLRNQWYCIEQYFRVNTVGASDGEIKTWVDGELAFHRTGIRVRDIPDIKIEKVWMSVYHGGTSPAGEDLHLYIDNVVIARRYIGPLRTQ
jgi:Disaggregatase related repeat